MQVALIAIFQYHRSPIIKICDVTTQLIHLKFLKIKKSKHSRPYKPKYISKINRKLINNDKKKILEKKYKKYLIFQ